MNLSSRALRDSAERGAELGSSLAQPLTIAPADLLRHGRTIVSEDTIELVPRHPHDYALGMLLRICTNSGSLQVSANSSRGLEGSPPVLEEGQADGVRGPS